MSDRAELETSQASSLRGLIASAAMLLVACSGGGSSNTPDLDPNIVMILADDHGYPYFGFMGSEVVSTPRIDELAREGIVFPVTYVTSSQCRASLQTLLSGLYPHQYRRAQAHLRETESVVLNGSEIQRFATLPRILAERGYASFQAGKLWEGTSAMAGFSEGTKLRLAARRSGERVSLAERLTAYAGGEKGLRIGRETMEPVFDFIDRHLEQPFFIWFAPMLPHKPLDPPAEFIRRYEGAGLSKSDKHYFANVTRLDAAVGRLLDHLEQRGLRENTLVVFLSDNGWEQDSTLHPKGGSRGKGAFYELGMRTPMIFSWPGRILAGQVEEGVVSSVDLFQTLLDFAGIEPLKSRSGLSLRPRIEGDRPHPRARIMGSTQVSRFPTRVGDRGVSSARPEGSSTRTFYVRDSNWHYVWAPKDSRDWLFDIRADPQEERNVSAQHVEVVADLRKALRAWEKEHSGPVDLYPEISSRGGF